MAKGKTYDEEFKNRNSIYQLSGCRNRNVSDEIYEDCKSAIILFIIFLINIQIQSKHIIDLKKLIVIMK